MTANLSLARRGGSWWIVGLADGDLGPYQTRADADDDRRGVLRFYRIEMAGARGWRRVRGGGAGSRIGETVEPYVLILD